MNITADYRTVDPKFPPCSFEAPTASGILDCQFRKFSKQAAIRLKMYFCIKKYRSGRGEGAVS
jgi:hypothetical protein